MYMSNTIGYGNDLIYDNQITVSFTPVQYVNKQNWYSTCANMNWIDVQCIGTFKVVIFRLYHKICICILIDIDIIQIIIFKTPYYCIIIINEQ